MIDSIRLIQTGDLHLGSPFSFAPELAGRLQQSQLETFWSIIRLCQEQQADVLLIAGDLFDQPVPDKALVRQVIEMLGSLTRTRVLVSPGNHDPFRLDSPYRTAIWPESVRIFGEKIESIELADQRVRIYGIGFSATVAAKPLLADLDLSLDPAYANLLLLHGDLYATSSRSPYNPLTPATLAGLGFDYVGLGHVHQFSGFINEGATTMAYAGCPFGRGFDETGIKGVIAGSISLSPGRMSPVPGQTPRPITPLVDLRFVPLDSRRFVELAVDVSNCSDQAAIMDRILLAMATIQGERFRDDLYKIILSGDLEDGFVPVLAILQQHLEGQVFYFKLRDRTKKRLDLSLLAHEHSLRGAFIRQINSRIEQARSKDQANTLEIAQKALDLGLMVMQGEDVTYAAD
jgi:exonuclease SbcD